MTCIEASIERALGVEKAREFYEQEAGEALSQSELARRLTADGYPVPQSHISRMSDAVRYLLPAILTVLYSGLGRHQVERLAVLRKACERTWERRALGRDPAMDFATPFRDVLSQFDAQVGGFSVQRVQDELVGQMAERAVVRDAAKPVMAARDLLTVSGLQPKSRAFASRFAATQCIGQGRIMGYAMRGSGCCVQPHPTAGRTAAGGDYPCGSHRLR